MVPQRFFCAEGWECSGLPVVGVHLLPPASEPPGCGFRFAPLAGRKGLTQPRHVASFATLKMWQALQRQLVIFERWFSPAWVPSD
ncbi:MAG: hypothetical protein D6691_00690 [Candidatus Hydrogenedentota bacterium]|nr:hypothetical protein [Candidatus Sumerlaea chitinivorans]RMH30851.1 MAG: hypothetical protein D6691_00690 [Candidatus Hydrogenedentota bacterium]GIX43721.1 MAG: hypothetical protein KatS3mg130_0129 [Candidatus Sumerlaea sp.]